MPHNPILKQENLGRTDRPKIELNQQGILCLKNQFRRLLNPGDNLSMNERVTGDLTLYIVDCAPRVASWRVDLPTRDLNDSFPVAIKLRYQVQDSRRMVEERVIDVEAFIAQALEPLLREQTRQYALNQYAEAEAAMRTILTPSLFTRLGLRLHEVDVITEFTKDDLARIEQLNVLARAMRVPQQVEHAAEWPTKEATFIFKVNVILSFKVINVQDLPTATLEEAEAWLWQRVSVTLRRVSRQYAVDQVAEAEIGLQDALESEVFSDHGLEIVWAQVAIDLDERARKHAEGLEALRAQKTLEDEQAKLDELRQQRKHAEEMEALRRKHAEELETLRAQKALEDEQAKLDGLLQQRKHADELETVRREYAEELEATRRKADLVEAQAALEKIKAKIKYDEELTGISTELTISVKRSELDDLLQKRQLDRKGLAIDFYKPYIDQGQWQLLAMALAGNKMDAVAVLNYLDNQQREKLGLQLELFKNMLEKDTLPEDIAERFTVGILDDLAKRAGRPGIAPAIGASENLQSLPTSHDEPQKEATAPSQSEKKVETEAKDKSNSSASQTSDGEAPAP